MRYAVALSLGINTDYIFTIKLVSMSTWLARSNHTSCLHRAGSALHFLAHKKEKLCSGLEMLQSLVEVARLFRPGVLFLETAESCRLCFCVKRNCYWLIVWKNILLVSPCRCHALLAYQYSCDIVHCCKSMRCSVHLPKTCGSGEKGAYLALMGISLLSAVQTQNLIQNAVLEREVL